MIPQNRFSSETFKGQLYNPWVREPNISRHWGPVAIQDVSQGLGVKLWQLRTADDGVMYLSAPGVSEFVWYTHGERITNVSLSFDQNGRPAVAFVTDSGSAYLRWFDPVPNTVVNFNISSFATTPHVTLDDNRAFNGANSDVILGYVRAGYVRYRQQRDRFTIEYTPTIGPGGGPAAATALHHVSMNSGFRLEFLTDGPGDEAWALADVVTELMAKSHVAPEHLDVSELYSDIVNGYRVAQESSGATNTGPLQQAWFFDPAEWDKKLRFVKRGKQPVATVVWDDLTERDNADSPVQLTRVQEIELLRKVNLTMMDISAGMVTNTQPAERRSATIKAKGESSDSLPIADYPDFIMSVAVKRLNIPWAEPNKIKFGLGAPFVALTPTDTITFTDNRNRTYHLRIAQIDSDYGLLKFDTVSNANWVYELQATGVSVPPSIPSIPGQRGNTVVIPLDIPVQRDQDDQLGYYIAVYGTGDGWGGGTVQLSADGGATVMSSLFVDFPSIVGTTDTELMAEHSSEYLSAQSLTVSLAIDRTLESTDREGILRYRNMVALKRADGSWEVMQFQTATPLGDNRWELTGLVRGRQSTEPLEVPVGATFVVIDTSLTFLRLQQWTIGQPIYYRGISNGQNPDSVSWETFSDDVPMSQTEWAPHMGRAVRDEAGNAKVTWIGRGRLGSELTPRNSMWFTGFRLTYSDGVVITTNESSHVRQNVPNDLESVVIEPMNSITGAGPAVEVEFKLVDKVETIKLVIDGGEVTP